MSYCKFLKSRLLSNYWNIMSTLYINCAEWLVGSIILCVFFHHCGPQPFFFRYCWIGGGRLYSNTRSSGVHLLVGRLYDRDARHVRLDSYALKPICLQSTRKSSQPFSSALLTPERKQIQQTQSDKETCHNFYDIPGTRWSWRHVHKSKIIFFLVFDVAIFRTLTRCWASHCPMIESGENNDIAVFLFSDKKKYQKM